MLIAVSGIASAQTFYSENMGVPTGNTLITNYVTGTAPATFQVGSPVVYSGTGDVRTSLPSSGYTGASGGGNVFLTSTAGRYFQIDGLNTSAYAVADLQLSFGYLTNSVATQVTLEVSVNGGTTWTPVTFTPNANTNWNLVTINDDQIPSSSTLSIRFTQPATAQMRIDDVKLTNVSSTCTISLSPATTACDAITGGIDTYTATIAYTGGGNATYGITATSGTIGGNNPTTTAEGNIIISGIVEGTAVTVTVTGGTCNLEQEVTAIPCKPINTLPFTEHFDYASGATLGSQQKWTNVNSGDEIIIGTGSLSYTGIGSSGNSATFSGAGIDARTPFTETTSGMIYAGFLMSVTDYSNVPADDEDGNPTAFVVLTETDNDFNARLFIKKVGEQFQLGLAAGTTPTGYTTSSYNVGDVLYIVIGYDFGSNGLSLWVNPTVATFTTSTQPTMTDAPASPFVNFGGFLLRQDANNSTPAISIDALRIATSLTEILGVAQNDIDGLSIYPNPVTGGTLYINTASNDTKSVQIFDVVGKRVVNASSVENSVNVSALNSGVYIVKITEAGKTATRKLVIR